MSYAGFSLTPRFSGVRRRLSRKVNRFSGFQDPVMVRRAEETAEAVEGSFSTAHTLLQRIGVNLRTCAKTSSPLLQPEGLTDSSRWSFGGKGGTTTGKCRLALLHPGGVPETNLIQPGDNGSGTPAGVQPIYAPCPGGRAPFPPRPPATICQPFGLETVEARFRRFPKVDADALKQGVNESGGS